MSEPARIYPCPNCKKPVRWSPKNKYRPFCTARCRLIDLGEWASENHRIPDDPGSAGVPSEDEDDTYS